MTEPDEKLALLESRINYSFRDRELGIAALTHSSYYNEHKKTSRSNERLEFLGDSVLSLITCEHLFGHTGADEGVLTKLRAALVCEDSLYIFAKSIRLGECLLFGKGEREEGLNRKSTLADATEAVLGAVYLDGGAEEARRLILPYIASKCTEEADLLRDYKSVLQEVIQKNKGELLSYEISGESGPAHDKRFLCHVLINSNIVSQGEGRSKKSAEQAAAREALRLMGIN